MRLISAFAIAAVFSLSMCGINQSSASVDLARDTLSRLAARLDSDEIGRVEIVFVPPRVLTRVPITPEAIEAVYHYKFTVRDLRNGLYEADLIRAVGTLSFESRDGLPDVRWGIIFYDVTDQRVAGIYLDGTGRQGAVDQNPVVVNGELYDWLQGQFSTAFR